MADRDVQWACSSCGGRFSTREDLTAHIAVEHGDHASDDIPAHDLANPSAAAIEPELPAQAEPDVITTASAEEPTAAPSLQPHYRGTAPALRALRWVALVAICAGAVGLGIAFHHQIAHQVALAVTTKPAPFTELYFSDPKGLPKSLSLSRPTAFDFTVVNHEGRDSVYWYVVTLASSYGSATIAQGRIDLGKGKGATTRVGVRPSRGATEYLITVNLVGRTESVWFRAVSQ